MNNPFMPAPGSIPPLIIGRGPEIAAIDESVRLASLPGGNPMPLIFTGRRGMGKTVLLRELRQRVEREAVVVALDIIKSENLIDRFRARLEKIGDEYENLPNRFGRILSTALKRIPKVTYEFPHDVGAISLGPEDDPAADRSDLRTLTQLLEATNEAARHAKRFLTLMLDEVQELDTMALWTISRFVNEAANEGNAPVLIALAGLPAIENTIQAMAPTYIKRWETFRLRLLTNAECSIALREPIESAGVKIEQPALERLVAECAGYPFFVQRFGNAAWDAQENGVIRLHAVDSIIPELRERLEYQFYADAFRRLSTRERMFVVAMADQTQPTTLSQIAARLALPAKRIGSIEQALLKKGVILETLDGKLEFRTPLSDRYIRSRRSTFQTAEVDAYHRSLLLKRS